MKLTVVAATGGIGRQLTQQALSAGHDVTVVVRNPAKLPADLAARVVTCDLASPDPATLEQAVAGSGGVLSGLGPTRPVTPGVAAAGTRALAAAMAAVRTRRLVVVSAAPVGTVPSPSRPHPPRHDPGDGFWMRHLLNPVVKAALRAQYADLAAMEEVVRESDLDWTVVRPPRLTDGPLTGSYATALDRNVRGGLSVSRADVAHAMLSALGEPSWNRHSVGLARLDPSG